MSSARYQPQRDEEAFALEEKELVDDDLDPAASSPPPSSRRSKVEHQHDDVFAKPLQNAKRKRIGNLPILAGVLALFLAGYLITAIVTSVTRWSSVTKQNVILMVSDGFGPASETLARSYVQYLHQSNHPSALLAGETSSDSVAGRWAFSAGFGGKDGVDKGGFGMLPLDRLLVGQSRTRSSNSLVTDSAAGATAFSCAIKSYNGQRIPQYLLEVTG